MGYNSNTQTLARDYPNQGDGISIEDVKNALNTTSRDLGTLCKSTSINLYSRHKPMESSEIGILTDQQKQALNYGYVFPVCYLDELIKMILFAPNLPDGWTDKSANSNYRALMNEWYYQIPTSKFRLLDFDGYKGGAYQELLQREFSPLNFRLGHNNEFYASLFQSDSAEQANFWLDGSNYPMSLTGHSYHAFGIVAVPTYSSGTTALVANDVTRNHGGQYCKYKIFGSPIDSHRSNCTVSPGDSLFVCGAQTYRLIPFIVGSDGPIQAYDNFSGANSEMLSVNWVMPLPCGYQSIGVMSADPPVPSTFYFVGQSTWELGLRAIVYFHVTFHYPTEWSTGSVNVHFEIYQGSTLVADSHNADVSVDGSGTKTCTLEARVAPPGSGQKFVVTLTRSEYGAIHQDMQKVENPQ